MTPIHYLRYFCHYEADYRPVLQQWHGVEETGQVCPPESGRGQWVNVPMVMAFKNDSRLPNNNQLPSMYQKSAYGGQE